MSEQLIVRLEPSLKAQAARLAQAEGRNLSAVVRELLARYVQDRDMSAHVEDLWDRAGNAMRQAGSGPEDVERVIREVRQSK